MTDEAKREVKWVAFGIKDIIIAVFIVVFLCIANHYIRSLHSDWRVGRLVEKDRMTQSIFNMPGLAFPSNLAKAFRQVGWIVETQVLTPIPPNVQESFEEESKEEEKE